MANLQELRGLIKDHDEVVDLLDSIKNIDSPDVIVSVHFNYGRNHELVGALKDTLLQFLEEVCEAQIMETKNQIEKLEII